MNNTNEIAQNDLNGPDSENQKTKIVDLELKNSFDTEKEKHEHDMSYSIRLDEQIQAVHERHITGRSILALVGKRPEDFALFQSVREDKVVNEVFIAPERVIVLEKDKIEYFITKALHVFFIEKKEFKTTNGLLTVRDILEQYAEVDPADKILAEKEGDGYHDYKNLDEEINMTTTVHHFTLFDKQPTGKS